jgi:type II secretory pathway pseudopilin PulG
MDYLHLHVRWQPVSQYKRREHASASRRAMTLVEMTIAVMLVAAVLSLLVGWSRTVRREAKTALTVRVLATLDLALSRYHQAHGVYPSVPNDEPAEVVRALLRDPASAPLADAIPPVLWSYRPPRRLLDAWGTPLKYEADPRKSRYVAANAGRPVFVSAGPDRDHGVSDRARMGDNLRSDDPGPHGFRDVYLVDDPPAAPDHASDLDRMNNGADPNAQAHH